jgi:hypothetical protein
MYFHGHQELKKLKADFCSLHSHLEGSYGCLLSNLLLIFFSASEVNEEYSNDCKDLISLNEKRFHDYEKGMWNNIVTAYLKIFLIIHL